MPHVATNTVHPLQGDSIILEGVDRHVEGSYLCTAENGIGDPVSSSMSVVVEYSPEIITEQVGH